MSNAVLIRARQLDIPTLAVIATDPDGAVIYWSEGAAKLYGWTETEALGRNIVELTPSEHVRNHASKIMGELRRGHTWSGEFDVQDKSGTCFLANVTDIPVRGTNGELLGIIGVSYKGPGGQR